MTFVSNICAIARPVGPAIIRFWWVSLLTGASTASRDSPASHCCRPIKYIGRNLREIADWLWLQYKNLIHGKSDMSY